MKLTINILFFLIIVNTAYTQGGSNYSILGIGDINYGGNAHYDALGGTSIAFPSITGINLKNPALWSNVTTTRLQAGYKFNQHINSNNDLTTLQNNGSLSGFSVIFAIDTNIGISASLGIYPYSTINYLTATKINAKILDLPILGTNTYQGKGGISAAYLGLSTKIVNELSVGLTLLSAFGKVEHSRITEYTDDPYLFKYTSKKEDVFSGIGLKGGFLTNPLKNFYLGYFFELMKNLDVESKIIYSSPLIGDTSVSVQENFVLPISQGFGLGFQSGIFQFGLDFSFQNYEDLKYNVNDNTKFTDSWQLNFGVNRIGNQSINAKSLDKVSYKFGLAVKKLYYKIFNNNIYEYSFSTGALIPWSDTFNTDISLTFGTRGINSNGLIREYYGRLNIDLSIGEIWFIPFKREY